MEIRIFGADCRFAGVCDRVIRFHASEEFAAPGTFTLRVPLSEAGNFAADSLLLLPGMQDAFVIGSVRRDSGTGICDISGSGVLSYFARRILTEEITYAGAAEELLTDLASLWGGAVLPGTLSTVSVGAEAAVNAAVGHQTVLAAMEEIAAAAGLGLRLQFSPEDGGFIFSVRRKSAGGVFLSRSLGNLAGVERTADYSRYLNRMHVSGNGGNLVTVDAAGLFDDGFDDDAQLLREGWEDATELAMDRYETEALYREALAARGRRILAQRRPRLRVSAQTDEATAGRLRLGEICPVRDGEIAASAVCTAKSADFDGKTLRHSAALQLTGGEES